MYTANRRQFLGAASKGLLASSLLGPFTFLAGNPDESSGDRPLSGDPIDVQLAPLNDPSEQKEPSYPAVIAPAGRLGYCIVGLGHLTLGEIIPAFAKCKYSRPVALVSGDAAKAAKVAAQYGIATKNVYSYANFDQIRDNKDIHVVYVVLPNSMHEEYTIRAAKAGKHVLCEKPMADSAAAAERMIEACKAAMRKLMIMERSNSSNPSTVKILATPVNGD